MNSTATAADRNATECPMHSMALLLAIHFPIASIHSIIVSNPPSPLDFHRQKRLVSSTSDALTGDRVSPKSRGHKHHSA
jgi:hypothetical protein